MQSIEAEGASVDEAIDQALVELNVDRADVDVEILSNPSRGLFGLGGRMARVRVTRRGSNSGAESASPAPTRAATHSDGDNRAVIASAQAFLEDLLRSMGFSSTVRADAGEEGPLLQIHGDNTSVLIGKHGQTLDALEYLVNRVACREEDGAVRINVDCEDYRAKRRRLLEDMAQRMAEQVKRRGRSIMLNPMSPRDRRIVHLALQGDPELTTRSSGEGFQRRLVILPANERPRGRSRQR